MIDDVDMFDGLVEGNASTLRLTPEDLEKFQKFCAAMLAAFDAIDDAFSFLDSPGIRRWQTYLSRWQMRRRVLTSQ